MENRVNWSVEHQILAWIQHQERAHRTVSEPQPILNLQVTRAEWIRSLLAETPRYDGLFGAASLPDSVL